jgi:hypothetical protein
LASGISISQSTAAHCISLSGLSRATYRKTKVGDQSPYCDSAGGGCGCFAEREKSFFRLGSAFA